MLKLFRTNTWWNTIVPQVLGWVYLCMQQPEYELGYFKYRVPSFFIALIAISVWGYLFNDLCDVKSDLRAGKKNSLAKFSMPVRLIITAVPLAIGIAAWAYVGRGNVANVLFGMQILALWIYSAPPFRLKGRGIAGVIADAFYGHVNPVFITLFAFYFHTNSELLTMLVLVLICITSVLKGIRNILLHQIDDRKADRRAGVQTYVVSKGALGILYFINNTLPFEVFFTVLLVVVLSLVTPPLLIWAIIFAVITYLKFSGWKLADIPRKQLKFKFLYFLNDFYENWLPVLFLVFLSIAYPQFSFLLILHLLMFPGFVTKLISDIKTIRENFKTEEEY